MLWYILEGKLGKKNRTGSTRLENFSSLGYVKDF